MNRLFVFYILRVNHFYKIVTGFGASKCEKEKWCENKLLLCHVTTFSIHSVNIIWLQMRFVNAQNICLLKQSFMWFNTDENIISFDSYLNLSIPYSMSYVTVNCGKLLLAMEIIYYRMLKHWRSCCFFPIKLHLDHLKNFVLQSFCIMSFDQWQYLSLDEKYLIMGHVSNKTTSLKAHGNVLYTSATFSTDILSVVEKGSKEGIGEMGIPYFSDLK